MIKQLRPVHFRAPSPAVACRLAALLAVSALFLLGPGCNDKKPTQPSAPHPGDGTQRADSTAKPDFHLTDTNPHSPTGGQVVSPRDELGKVSAWYFGHAG